MGPGESLIQAEVCALEVHSECNGRSSLDESETCWVLHRWQGTGRCLWSLLWIIKRNQRSQTSTLCNSWFIRKWDCVIHVHLLVQTKVLLVFIWESLLFTIKSVGFSWCWSAQRVSHIDSNERGEDSCALWLQATGLFFFIVVTLAITLSAYLCYEYVKLTVCSFLMSGAWTSSKNNRNDKRASCFLMMVPLVIVHFK